MVVKSALLLCIVALACLYSTGASAADDESAAISTKISRPRHCARVRCRLPRICRFKKKFTLPGQCCRTCCAVRRSKRCPIYCPRPKIWHYRRHNIHTRCCPKCKPYYCRFVRCRVPFIRCLPGQKRVSHQFGCCRHYRCVGIPRRG